MTEKGISAAMGSQDCLVGYTGFVGQALLRARKFSGCYNSANIAELAGRSYATLVCAAAPATMWAANARPEADKANLRLLAQAVGQAKADRVVLISTIAVLDDPAAGYTESTARYESAKAYGRHRRELELELMAACERLHILRLPALFGQGLKKNFIFDLINPAPSFLRPDAFARIAASLPANVSDALGGFYCYRDDMALWQLDRAGLNRSGLRAQLEQALEDSGLTARNFTNSASRFQFYNIDRLAGDIDWAITHDLGVLNICSEPIAASELCRTLTGRTFGAIDAALYHEDMRSDHGERFGNAAPWLYSREAVLEDLQEFHRKAAAP